MAWAKAGGDIAVIFAFCVGVADQQSNRRAGRFALKHTGQYFNLIGLRALAGMARAARGASL